MVRPRIVRFAKFFVRHRAFRRASDFIVRTIVSTKVDILHSNTRIQLIHPNPQTRSRNNSFSTKEPDTLAWIERFPKGSVLWDVGANVGLYSVYAALCGASVVSIEPSVFNLEFLVRNISINRVSDRVQVLPVAVGGVVPGFSKLSLQSTAWGDSQNAFATLLGQSGEQQDFEIDYQTLGFPLDSLTTVLHIAPPSFLKIDVDGIEPDILESGSRVLSAVQSVLVEIPLYASAQMRIHKILTSAGLRLESTLRRNQIWRR